MHIPSSDSGGRRQNLPPVSLSPVVHFRRRHSPRQLQRWRRGNQDLPRKSSCLLPLLPPASRKTPCRPRRAKTKAPSKCRAPAPEITETPPFGGGESL